MFGEGVMNGSAMRISEYALVYLVNPPSAWPGFSQAEDGGNEMVTRE